MYKYLIGASEPKGVERKQTPEDRAEKFKKYEATWCKHSFCPQWKVNWPWLRLEQIDENEVMFCNFCIRAGLSAEKTNFISGCTSMHLESMKSH